MTVPTFTKDQSYDVTFVINGDLRTVQAAFTGTVSKAHGQEFARFERMDPQGRLRIYEISLIGWNKMQKELVGEAGSHDTFTFTE